MFTETQAAKEQQLRQQQYGQPVIEEAILPKVQEVEIVAEESEDNTISEQSSVSGDTDNLNEEQRIAEPQRVVTEQANIKNREDNETDTGLSQAEQTVIGRAGVIPSALDEEDVQEPVQQEVREVQEVQAEEQTTEEQVEEKSPEQQEEEISPEEQDDESTPESESPQPEAIREVPLQTQENVQQDDKQEKEREAEQETEEKQLSEEEEDDVIHEASGKAYFITYNNNNIINMVQTLDIHRQNTNMPTTSISYVFKFIIF